MTERLNASALLDRNLDAGRAEKPAYLTADGAVFMPVVECPMCPRMEDHALRHVGHVA